jgi:hypothetical protein
VMQYDVVRGGISLKTGGDRGASGRIGRLGSDIGGKDRLESLILTVVLMIISQ